MFKTSFIKVKGGNIRIGAIEGGENPAGKEIKRQLKR